MLELAQQQRVLDALGARSIKRTEPVQSLWSGYGSIERIYLIDGRYPSAIVKQIRPPQVASHPRGWATQTGDRRKRQSYAVEAQWYRHFAGQLPQDCRVARPLLIESTGDDGWILVLEDLAADYPGLPEAVTLEQAADCLRWLAALHAHCLHQRPEGLWPCGCYWHLDTRPDELAAMPEGRLKSAARQMDLALAGSPFQTLVHGDAKLANFCFATNSVAAVDFQYVGAGPGVRDLAYFLGSAFDEGGLQRHAGDLVDEYFGFLRGRLPPGVDADAIETDWRGLLPIAWADFTRFLLGWAPEHRKLNDYTRHMVTLALAALPSHPPA